MLRRHGLRDAGEIGIAAGNHQREILARQLARQQRRQRRRAARLDQQFELEGGESDGAGQFFVADRDAGRQQSVRQREHMMPGTGAISASAMESFPPGRATCAACAASDRFMPSKFSGSTLCTGAVTPAPFSASATPDDQPAAGTGRRHRIQCHAETRRILGDLQPRRALPRHDAGIVIGLDQGGAPLGADARGDGFAVVACTRS